MTGEPAGPGAIAIIGMAGRFPGAHDVHRLWANLVDGVESIDRFAVGHDPELSSNPRFVGAEGLLDGIESFDAEFFGYSPREAAIMDPQHRLSLEVAWHAFEDAGYDPKRCPGPVGTFVSVGLSSYLVRNLLPQPDLAGLIGGFRLLIHNDKDFAATTLAYKLGLTGPAIAVGSACSSSLVAVHLACQSLHTTECDLAIAGGASIQVPQRQGYVHADDSIYSPDGHCRPFDAAAAGTVGGSGVAMVVLKRLADAVRDGDRVHAVILGSAVNNDGGSSVGYTAPSVDGQLSVIAEALSVAGVPADSIGYLEAHGTGTPLGDSMEIEAATQAFRLFTEQRRFCAIGSVKANLGHLDAAAGVTGLVKAALAVKHGRLPPHPTFTSPHPGIAFDQTPFYVNTDALDWPGAEAPRRAGVSSFGIGGTNAHVILEQPAEQPARPPARPWQLLAISARTEAGLNAATAAVTDRVRGLPAARLAEVAGTLATRRAFPHRRAVICRDGAEAAAALEASTIAGAAAAGTGTDRPVIFMFPGQSGQPTGISAELCRAEPAFRGHVDECAELLAGTGIDLLGGTHPQEVQAALFVFEYALARTLQGWGLRPAAVIGHSLGEYAAATVAGALPLDAALRLVVGRARLVERTAEGGMLAVWAAADELQARLDGSTARTTTSTTPTTLSVAAVNAPDACVVAGSLAELEGFAAELERAGISSRRLPGVSAFHSALMEPVLADFGRLASGIRHEPARLDWVSTRTGEPVPPGQVIEPEHWVRHLREPAQFDAGIRHLLDDERAVFIEVGPSTTLSSIVRRHPARTPGQLVLSCQPHAGSDEPPLAALLGTVTAAWTAGCAADLAAVHGSSPRADCPLYPFQRERHWVDAPTAAVPARSLPALLPELERRLGELAADEPIRGIASYPGLAAGLDELCAALALQYLSPDGNDTAPFANHDPADLRKRLEIRPAYERFFEFLIDVLAAEGILDRHDGGITFLDSRRPGDPQAVATAIKRAHPEFTGLVDLLLHCGSHYREALSTPGAALGVLYPGGTGDLLRRTLGEQTVEFSVTGRLVRLVTALIEKLARSPGRLRILEVGAGAGRLTWEIAGVLRERLLGNDAEFVVTDIGRAFVGYLAEEAASRGFDIQTRVLDISREPSGQGFAAQSFDVVVGLDVVHATPDVPAALANLRGLLAPGGLLALIETVAEDRWLSMVWGLAEDWWTFTDELRERTPLLGPRQWQSAVAAAGFAATAVLPGTDAGDARDAADAVVVLGQQPAAPARRSPLAAADLPDKRPDVADWCYLPGWRRGAPVAAADPGPAATEPARAEPARASLVFTDGPLGDAVITRLRQRGRHVVAVRPDALDLADEDGYKRLLDRLDGSPDLPDLIVHLWNVGEPAAGSRLERLDETQRRGLFSLLSLVRALAERGTTQPIRLLAVTSHAQEVLGGELTAPERSTVHAAVKVIPREYPQISCSSVDVATDADIDWVADRIVDELLSTPAAADEATVAYRGLARWLPSFTPWRLAPAPATPARPRPGGVYLICGGLGGIGLSIAEELGRLPAAVVLTRRTPFPARHQWAGWPAAHPADDPTSDTIRRLREIEAHGGQVLVQQADITSLPDMRAAVASAVERFGAITGVIHAAGVLDTAGVIQRRSIAETWTAIAAKVRGALVLEEVLRDQELEFAVFCSSIGAVLHKLKFGEVGYVAGNEFLNAYACYRAAAGDRATVAIAWTDWLEAGMWTEARKRLEQRYAEPASTSGFHPTDDLLRALTTTEGIEVFRRVLARPVAPNLVISTQDLDELLARHDAFTHEDHVQVLETMRLSAGSRRRPELGSEYIAPRTAAERAAAAIWEALLGVDGIGVHDDFFALGGDSLIALRFLARLRDELGLERTVADLFETPTLAGLLAASGQAGGVRDEEVVL